MKTQKQTIEEVEFFSSEKEVFLDVISAIKDTFIASINRESDTSILMTFLNGEKFRLTLEKCTH